MKEVKHRWARLLTTRSANCLFDLYNNRERSDREFHKFLRVVDFTTIDEAALMKTVKEDIENKDLILKRARNCGKVVLAEITEWCNVKNKLHTTE